MKVRARIHHLAGVGLLAGSLTLGFATTGVSNSGAAVKGHVTGTVRIALTATSAKWIFPFVPSYRFTVTNVSTFQQPMYRPCYWFGLGPSVAPQPALSICQTPHWLSATKLTITMNHYKWSNGAPVTAKDFMFFMNMYKNHPFDYGGYFPGFGIPDQIKNAAATSTYVITITLKSPANHTWFLYNALAEITPMPRAWDISTTGGAPGSGHCEDASWASVTTTGTGACNNVWTYLACDPAITGASCSPGQAATRSTYQTNPLWQIVDGPYHLTAYDSTTLNMSMAPNPHYSGTAKKAAVNLDFTHYLSLSAEETALLGGQLDLGTVKPSEVHAAPSPGKAGGNIDPYLTANFNVRTGAFWGFDYAYVNFNSSAGGSGSKLMNSLAVRSALEMGINQAAIIKAPNIYNGYAVPDCSPLPYLNDPYAKKPKCPYLFSIANAKDALVDVGWSGTHAPLTCTKTGGCEGVPKYTKLAFTYFYPAGSPTQDTQLQAEQVTWGQVGFQVTLDNSKDSNTIATFCLSTSVGPNGNWSICQYGGWVYSPGAYPSGEQFLLPKAASNAGEVNNGALTTSIIKSISTSTSLAAYNQTAANFVPLLFQPSALGTGEGRKTLLGIQPPNPLSDFNPEYIRCASTCQ